MPMAAGAPSERRGTQRRCQKPRDTSRQDIERYMHLSSADAAKALVMEFGHGRLILIVRRRHDLTRLCAT